MKSSRIQIVLAAVVLSFIATKASLAAEPTPLLSANPMIGTSAHGHTYPGATIPFGMVQLSPDTRFETWDGCSGYHYSDKAIYGFSHTHLSGTGCADLGDIRIVPRCGGLQKNDEQAYASQSFSHSDETARPGYYSVLLGDPKIKAELTATAHAGFHRYTFPSDQPASLLVDLDRGIGSQTEQGVVTIESTDTIAGSRHTHGWAADKTFYFVAKFSQPFGTIVGSNREIEKEGDKEKVTVKTLGPRPVRHDSTQKSPPRDFPVRRRGAFGSVLF